MYATRPTRYFVAWDSTEIHAQLKARALANGTYSDEHDDWFEPTDIEKSVDGGESLEGAREIARQHLSDALYGQVNICERVCIERVGRFWDYDETKVVEVVESAAAPR